MLVLILSVLVLVGVEGRTHVPKQRRPNILFILADDLGFNDVSWHNKEFRTPTLEKLAREGVILEQSYAQQVCTPSRAALLTGKYPFHIGRQKRALKPLQPTGLSVKLQTLPQQLKKLGYQTHMVGKWHLGYCSVDYTPTRRGFDTFLGFYLGSQNYYTHDRDYKTKRSEPPSYDFRKNEAVAKDGYSNVYSTEIFRDRTIDILESVKNERDLNAYQNYEPFFIYLAFQATHAPLQARSEMLSKIPPTENPSRDIYKAMALDMDYAINDIVDGLKKMDFYNNTIIVFTTDNGGAISHGASNWPLRGSKGTLFEGGTRAVSFLHAPNRLNKTGYVNSKLIHITDWMPTLLKQAGYPGDPSRDLGLDGVDQWDTISRDTDTPRQEMVYNLKKDPVSGAIRIGDYKIIFGRKFNKQGWYDVDSTALLCSRIHKKQRRKLQKSSELITDSQLQSSRRGRRVGREKRRRIQKRERKENKKSKKREEKYTKKVMKIWKDWLPAPSVGAQALIRYRMDNCNWLDFVGSGHDTNTQLNPRILNNYTSTTRNIISILDPVPNPFNITAEDEDSEFEDELETIRSISPGRSLENQFDEVDSALYNVREDPQEKRNLKLTHPEIFQKLRGRAIYHLSNIAPEDFPPPDFSGHPSKFNGVFSSGWCTAK